MLGSSTPAEHLKIVHQSMCFALRQLAFSQPVVSSSRELLDYLRLDLAGEPVEQVRGLYLDAKMRLIGDVLLARGSLVGVALSPREVVRVALDLGATSLILIHNHPSGDPTPSRSDVEASRRLLQSTALFDIQVHDHLIVGADRCVSLAALGLLEPAP